MLRKRNPCALQDARIFAIGLADMTWDKAIDSYNEGVAAAKEGRLDDAAELLKAAVFQDPTHVNSHNVLGKVLIRTGAVRQAQTCWKTALTLDPSNETARACLRSLGKKRLKRVLRSLTWGTGIGIVLGVLLSINWGTTWVRADIRRLSALFGDRPVSSEEFPQAPASVPVLEAVTSAASSNAPERDSEGPIVSQTPVWEKEMRASYQSAERDYRERNFSLAMGNFSAVIEVPHPHPLKDNAQYWIGECWYAQGQYQRALTSFEKVRTRYPHGNKVLHAHIKEAYCYYRLGQTAKARASLVRLQQRGTQDSDALEAMRRLSSILGSERSTNRL
ncbi:MAG: tetratricopeptide repeat protein [Candidatus Latescibacterota bacterium]